MHLFMSLLRADEKVDGFLKLPSDDKKSAPYSAQSFGQTLAETKRIRGIRNQKVCKEGIYCC